MGLFWVFACYLDEASNMDFTDIVVFCEKNKMSFPQPHLYRCLLILRFITSQPLDSFELVPEHPIRKFILQMPNQLYISLPMLLQIPIELPQNSNSLFESPILLIS